MIACATPPRSISELQNSLKHQNTMKKKHSGLCINWSIRKSVRVFYISFNSGNKVEFLLSVNLKNPDKSCILQTGDMDEW